MPILPALKDCFSFFAERCYAFAKILRLIALLLRDGFEVECLGKRMRLAIGEGALDSSYGQRRAGPQPRSPIVHHLIEFLDRQNAVDQAELGCLLRVDNSSRYHPLECFGVTNHARQKIST